MDAARELTKLLERDAQLAARSGQKLLGCLWIRGQLSLGEAQGERQRDESLLRAIVEIAFQPPRSSSPADTRRARDASSSPRASSFARASETSRVNASSRSSAPGQKECGGVSDATTTPHKLPDTVIGAATKELTPCFSRRAANSGRVL